MWYAAASWNSDNASVRNSASVRISAKRLGGVDWEDAAQPIFKLGWALGLMFAFYVAVSVLCVLNIMTGVRYNYPFR